MTNTPPPRSRAATMSLWLAIGSLIAAALMGGFFIIVGDQANVAGRAWLTLFLVLLFAGAVVLDANVSDGPNRWYLTASTITNVVIVAIGLLKLWNGWLQGENTSDPSVWATQFGRLLAIILLLRLALLITQLYGLHFVTRARSQIGKVTSIVTIGMVWVTALVLAVPAAFPAYEWPEWWWRIAGAAALIAVVMTVIPLVIRAFEPKPERPVQEPAASVPAGYAQHPGYAQQGYPQQPVYAPAQQQYQPVPPEYQQPVAAQPQAVPEPPAPVPPVAPPEPTATDVDGQPSSPPVPPQ